MRIMRAPTLTVRRLERELYGIRAGLETIETFAAQTRAVRPLEQRLRSPVRLRQAVEAAVGPLADRADGR